MTGYRPSGAWPRTCGLAPNTVARAYRELERAGVIETRGRAGSFVTGDQVAGRAKAAAAAYLAETAALGLDAVRGAGPGSANLVSASRSRVSVRAVASAAAVAS